MGHFPALGDSSEMGVATASLFVEGEGTATGFGTPMSHRGAKAGEDCSEVGVARSEVASRLLDWRGSGGGLGGWCVWSGVGHGKSCGAESGVGCGDRCEAECGADGSVVWAVHRGVGPMGSVSSVGDGGGGEECRRSVAVLCNGSVSFRCFSESSLLGDVSSSFMSAARALLHSCNSHLRS